MAVAAGRILSNHLLKNSLRNCKSKTYSKSNGCVK